MKLITAVLRPDSLDAVHDVLDPSEARVMSAALVVDDRYSVGIYRDESDSLDRETRR